MSQADPLVQLDNLRAQRAALADFGLFAFRCGDLDQVLTRACALISEALDVRLVKVLEHRPLEGGMLIRGGVNWAPGVVGEEVLGGDERSPAGYALLQDEAVVSIDLDTETRFEIPEVLRRHGVQSMINVIIEGEERPFGVLEVDATEKCAFDEDSIAFLRTYANLLAAAITRIAAQQKLESRAREQAILARELQHRGKNLLGLVQALVSQSAGGERSADEVKAAIQGRLSALAAAEGAVFNEQADEIEMQGLAEDVLSPYRAERPEAVAIDGTGVMVPARSGRMLGLALHELATNAAKHGALSVPEGRVHLVWRARPAENGCTREVHLEWKESGGPEVVPSGRRGFGTRLLEVLVSQELDGRSELRPEPAGLVYRLVFPLP